MKYGYERYTSERSVLGRQKKNRYNEGDVIWHPGKPWQFLKCQLSMTDAIP